MFKRQFFFVSWNFLAQNTILICLIYLCCILLLYFAFIIPILVLMLFLCLIDYCILSKPKHFEIINWVNWVPTLIVWNLFNSILVLIFWLVNCKHIILNWSIHTFSIWLLEKLIFLWLLTFHEPKRCEFINVVFILFFWRGADLLCYRVSKRASSLCLRKSELWLLCFVVLICLI